MPPVILKPKPNVCKACSGTGKNSKGNQCYPCQGSGRQSK